MKLKTLFNFIFIYLLCLGMSVSFAQEETVSSENPSTDQSASEDAPKLSVEESLQQRIALDLRDMDVVDALKFLAQKANVNIIAGKDVTGRVSLFVKGVTAQHALNIILRANDLAYEKRGDLLYVMTDKEYKATHGSNFNDLRKVKIINLKFAKPESVFKAVDTLKSDIGKVLVDEESGSVILMDTPEKIKEMEAAVENLDRVTETRTFPLKYAKTADVEQILAKRLDAKKTGMVSVDFRNDAVIVTAFPDRMKEIEEIIKGLDEKTKQVLIEAKIIKVILDDNFSMGIDWSRVFTEANLKGLNFAGNYALSTPTDFFKIGVGNDVASGYNYSAVIQILKEYGDTRNLSSPSIAVIDGQEAKMLVGTTQAYVTTTVATGGTTATTAAQVTFLDVGVQLTLTPYINGDGFVTMKIKPEVSSVDGTLSYQIAPSVNNEVPLVAKTTAETTIMVKDGRTIVIGGLSKDETVKKENKLPLLGDIPVLGHAFKKTVNTSQKSEIVVFITPHIISGEDDVWSTASASSPKPKGTRSYE
jgi:type II secretory pathway component GspD/PulD (secretin)